MDLIENKCAAKDQPGWSLYPAKEYFNLFQPEWDNLNAELFKSHPLFDSHFVDPLIRHFAGENTFIALYREKKRIEGMTLVKHRPPGIWSTFLPSQQQVAPVLFSPDVYLRIHELFSILPGLSLSLEWLCQDPLYSPCFICVPRLGRETNRHVTTTSISLDEMFSDYWGRRSKNLRRNVKRYFHRLEKDCKPTNLKVITNPTMLADALAVYGDIESSGWKGETDTAIHSNNLQGKFYLDILKGFGSKGKAYVYQLFIKDELVASRLCIANNFMLIVLKTTYSENCAKYAPGWLLLHLMLEREFERQQFNTIEFYTNASPEQLRWATQTRNIEHITIYRSKSHLVAFNLLRKTKKFLNGYRVPNSRTKNA